MNDRLDENTYNQKGPHVSLIWKGIQREILVNCLILVHPNKSLSSYKENRLRFNQIFFLSFYVYLLRQNVFKHLLSYFPKY